MHTKDNYGGLDRFRLIAALLVIAIHTSPLGSFCPEGDFFLTRVLARIAVPFFFLVTGQFVAGKFIPADNDPRPLGRRNPDSPSPGPGALTVGEQTGHQVLLRYLRKILVLYGISILLYLPVGIYAGHYQDVTFLSLLKMVLSDGTFYHLWYFPACLWGIVLVYLMGRFLKLRGMIAVSAVLYLVGLLGDSYFGLVQGLPPLETIYGFFFQFCSYTRNGLFFAPLFLALGAWCARSDRGRTTSHLAILVPLSADDCGSLHPAPFFLAAPRQYVCDTDSGNDCPIPPPAVPSRLLWESGETFPQRLPVDLYPAPCLYHSGAGRGKSVPFDAAPCGQQPDTLLCRVRIIRRHRFWDCFPRRACSRFMPQNSCPFPPREMRTAFGIRGKSPLPHPSLRGRAWIELDKTALARNVEYLRSLLPEGCRLMPAVKANAYGHGAVWTATELNRLGVDAFCVACLSEGIALRRAKVKGEILILGYTAPEDFTLLARYRLTQTVIDYEYAGKLADAGVMLHVHIGIDTGMHRLGIRCEDTGDILAVFEMGNLVIDGMFTHLCACDSSLPEDRAFTESQIQAFYGVVGILEERGLACPRLHLQSSYGLLNYPGLDADYVRAGIALYGVPSTVMNADFHKGTDSAENTASDRTSCFPGDLAPVLSLKARVASIRTLHAGESAGYGLAFTAEQDMRIAVLSIGYADGLPRELSCGRGHVLLHGLKAPVIGRICMDQTLVDISGIPQASAGDTAVLIGTSGNEEITAVQLASQCGTITNELLSRLGERLERVEIDSSALKGGFL